MIDADALHAAVRALGVSDTNPDHETLVCCYLHHAGFTWEATNVVSDTERVKRRLVGPWQHPIQPRS